MGLTRKEIAERILSLPPAAQEQAKVLLEDYLGSEDERDDRLGPRNAADRRVYDGKPWDYIADILGYELTPQQRDALCVIEANDKVLVPAGNNIGKTFLLAAYAIYFFDVVGARLDDEGHETGARILLPGPDHKTIQNTIWSEILTHLARAERRGFRMPGEWSEKSILWRSGPMWNVEPMSPQKRVEQQQAHGAAGRHAPYMMAVVEEGQGVDEQLWRAVERNCSSPGNKIVSAFNPTEPFGPAYSRAASAQYEVLHLDVFDHPNVRQREHVIPAAIDFRVIDAQVKTCEERGDFPHYRPDPVHNEFIYALPPHGAAEKGARPDGHVGHPDGKLVVYRPTPLFQARVRGQWPQTGFTGLFDPGAWDKANQRWTMESDPDEPPFVVGVDCAREGDDDTMAVPVWGPDPYDLLDDWWQAELRMDSTAMESMRSNRVRAGRPEVAPKGDGPKVARWLDKRFPGNTMFVVDETGVGSSILDHLTQVLHRQAIGLAFGAKPLPSLDGEEYCSNLKTSIYVRAARLVKLGLLDIPPDRAMREEALAQAVEYRDQSVTTHDPRGKEIVERHTCTRIEPKKDVKKKIGRSPDRCDALVLGCFSPGERHDGIVRAEVTFG
jgi:hypothetical protein